MVVKKFYWHGHASFFCQKISGKKICSTAARRSQKMLFAFSKKPFFRFAIFVPVCRLFQSMTNPVKIFYRVGIHSIRKPAGACWLSSALFLPDAKRQTPQKTAHGFPVCLF